MGSGVTAERKPADIKSAFRRLQKSFHRTPTQRSQCGIALAEINAGL